MNVTDPLIILLICISFCYRSFCYREKVINNKEFGLQNSKPHYESHIRHDPLSQTLNNTNFYLSVFPAKINNKIVQNKEKTLFWGHFRTK